MSLIVDISRWQGVIPLSTFKSWKAFGVTRVVIKAGGADDGVYKDASHDQHVTNARAAALGVDHYFFNGPGDPASLAKSFVSFAKPQAGDKLWYDVENEGSMPHATPANALTFGKTTKAACGILAGLYMSSSVTREVNWSTNVSLGQELWVAQYGTNNGDPQGKPSIAYWKSYTYWQYTSNETLPGYGGRLDASLPSGAVASVAPSSSAVSINRTSHSTEDLQKAINALGYSPALVVDGIPGPLTQAGIQWVEKKFGLTVDSGIAGPQVEAALWPAAKSTPAPATKPVTPAKIKEDGLLGSETIGRWQEVLGTPIDHTISPTGSTLVAKVQTILNNAGKRDWEGKTLVVDGVGASIVQNGSKTRTIWALQEYLGTGVDGKLDSPSPAIVALQKRLNAGSF